MMSMIRIAFALIVLAGAAHAQTYPQSTFGSVTTNISGSTNGGLTIPNNSGYSAFNVVPIATANLPSGISVFSNSFSSSFSGGTLNNVKDLENNALTITGAPNMNWWVGLDQLTFSGTGGTGQHVARYAQTTRYGYGSGGASNNPPLWAMVAENDDFTGLKSSQTNYQLSMEFDITGHNLDDANNRMIISSVIRPAADNSNFYEASTGYSLTVNSGAYAKKMLSMGGNFTNSTIDLRYSSGYYRYATSLTPVTFPTVTSTVSASTTVPVSNIMPFTSDIYGRDINTTPSTVQVVFSDTGNVATVTSYTVTGSGPTPTGTLTVSSPVSVASGASVYNQSKGIWLPTYMPIALDTGGATTLFSDGTYIHSAPLTIGTSNPANGYFSPVTASVTIGDVGNTAPYGTHISIAQTTAPTITNGTLDATGSDVAGTVTLSAANPVVTFKVAYATVPHCVVSSPTGTSFSYAVTTTALSLTGGASTNKFTYHCLQ